MKNHFSIMYVVKEMSFKNIFLDSFKDYVVVYNREY